MNIVVIKYKILYDNTHSNDFFITRLIFYFCAIKHTYYEEN